LRLLIEHLLPAADFLREFKNECKRAATLIVRLPSDIYFGSEIEASTVALLATLGLDVEVFRDWNR